MVIAMPRTRAARALTAALLALPAGQGQAACEVLTFLSCETGNGRQLEVCADDRAVTYAFGPPGSPELALANPIEAPGYTPWPGAGRTLWESVGFEADGHLYEVFLSVDRLEHGSELGAGVTVSRGGETLATLHCVPPIETAGFWALSDFLEQRGRCWDLEGQAWKDCR